YLTALAGARGLKVLEYDPATDPNYQYVVVEVDTGRRDAIVSALQAENILARKYFWPGCHRMQPYRELYPHAGLLLEQTESVAERVVVLPTGPGLPEGAVSAIAAVFRVVGAAA